MWLLCKLRKVWQRLIKKFDEWLAPRCPVCESAEVWTLDVDVETNTVTYECKRCSHRWMED